MKAIHLTGASLLAALASVLSLQAHGQTLHTLHSASCEAVNPSALHKVKVEDIGLFNDSPPASVWTVCPIPLEFFDSAQQDSYFSVLVGNVNEDSVTTPCIFKATNAVTGDLIQRSQKVTVQPGEWGEYEWEVNNTSLLWPTVTCKLLPNTVLGPLYYGTQDF